MQEITLQVIPGEEDEGGFTAWWDDLPGHGGITTQGETLAELQEMVIEAVSLYFEGQEAPKHIRLHFQKDPVIYAADETSERRQRLESETRAVEVGV
jgi:predicted RNase H-like HicB family nuclease